MENVINKMVFDVQTMLNAIKEKMQLNWLINITNHALNLMTLMFFVNVTKKRQLAEA